LFKKSIHQRVNELVDQAVALEDEALDKRADIQAQIYELSSESNRLLETSILASRIASAKV
jgi:hypothetical protein